MRTAIIGAGAVGQYLASCLIQNNIPVTLIDSNMLKGIDDEFIDVKVSDWNSSQKYQLHCKANLNEIYELIIFAVQTQDIQRAYLDSADFMEESLVLTIQNGVQAENILSSHFERENVFAGLLTAGCTQINRCELRVDFPGKFLIGKPFSDLDKQTHRIVKLFSENINARVSADIKSDKWSHLLICLLCSIPALIGASMKETFQQVYFQELAINVMKEAMRIVRFAGIEFASSSVFNREEMMLFYDLPNDEAMKVLFDKIDFLKSANYDGWVCASLKKNENTEIEFLNGEIVHLAHQTRQKAEYNNRILDSIHQIHRTNQFYTVDQVRNVFEGSLV